MLYKALTVEIKIVDEIKWLYIITLLMVDFVDTFPVLFKYITRMTAFPGYDVEGVTSLTCTGTAAFIIV